MPKVLISDSMSNVAQKIFEKNNISVDVKLDFQKKKLQKLFKIMMEWLLGQQQK